MDIEVRIYEDPHSFSAVAGEFLRSHPVLHNLILTIVDRRFSESEEGHYWVAFCGEKVVGVALQSPLTYPATVVPMEPEVAVALVDAIADSGSRPSGGEWRGGDGCELCGEMDGAKESGGSSDPGTSSLRVERAQSDTGG